MVELIPIPPFHADCALPNAVMTWLADVVNPKADNRAIVLLSHHQYYFSFERGYCRDVQVTFRVQHADRVAGLGARRGAVFFRRTPIPTLEVAPHIHDSPVIVACSPFGWAFSAVAPTATNASADNITSVLRTASLHKENRRNLATDRGRSPDVFLTFV